MTQEKAIQEAKEKLEKFFREIVPHITEHITAKSLFFEALQDLDNAIASSSEKGDKKFSESEVYTAINMARGVTFQTDREPTFHHSNIEIVQYLNSITPKEHSEGEAERNIDNLTSF